MSVEYKVIKGIYTRKYQAKKIWEVGGACVEKQRIQRNFAMCLNPPCEIFARGFFMVRSGQISHHEENLLAKLVIWHDAVVFRRPYLPHFSSKSYKVWSFGFLTSRALKWYIACKKWTSGSAPKVRKKTAAAVLFASLHFASLLAYFERLWQRAMELQSLVLHEFELPKALP